MCPVLLGLNHRQRLYGQHHLKCNLFSLPFSLVCVANVVNV